MSVGNSMLDALATLPYFRGKGTLALTVLRAFRRETLTARLPYGGRMALGLDTMRQSVLPYWIGKYEVQVSRTLRQYLQSLPPGQDVIDIGANIGFYTVIAAGALQKRGSGIVHSFEPNPRVFAELEHNVALNAFRNVSLNCEGVGDIAKQATLFVNAQAVTYSSLRRTQEFLEDEINVPIITLDDYARTPSFGGAGLIKLDVEGAELLVLRGGRELLKRDQPVLLYEEFEKGYRQFGYSTSDVRNFLRDLNYRLYAIGARDLQEIAGDDTNSAAAPGYQNVLALPAKRQ